MNQDYLIKTCLDDISQRLGKRARYVGAISRRIARLTKDPALAQDAEILYQEIQSLESHLERFEKYTEI